jgi:SOS response regulatory protein OraA/RecX
MQVDNHQNKDLEIKNAKNYCLRLLAKKDCSVSEIKQKLRVKGFEIGVIQNVVEELLNLKFLDDKRLAHNLILAYQGTKGKMWIVQKMRQQGLGQEVIKQAFEEFRVENLPQNLQNEEQSDTLSPNNQIKMKLEKKYAVKNWQELDQNTKQKVVGFLARNGFENAFGVIKEWAGGE